MEISIKQSHLTKNIDLTKSLTLSEKIAKVCTDLEDWRILLMSAFLLLQGAVILPITLLVVNYINIGWGDFTAVLLVANTLIVLIVNISEAPIKLILGSFALSILASAFIIAAHLVTL